MLSLSARSYGLKPQQCSIDIGWYAQHLMLLVVMLVVLILLDLILLVFILLVPVGLVKICIIEKKSY